MDYKKRARTKQTRAQSPWADLCGADEKRENSTASAMVLLPHDSFRFSSAWPCFAKDNDDIDVDVFTAITFLHTLIPFSPSKKVFIVSFFHLARLHAYSVASHQRLHSREKAVI